MKVKVKAPDVSFHHVVITLESLEEFEMFKSVVGNNVTVAEAIKKEEGAWLAPKTHYTVNQVSTFLGGLYRLLPGTFQ
jgi:hypothetical protein